MSASERSFSSSLVPAIAAPRRGRSFLSAILSQWPLIWARGAPNPAEDLPDYLRRDIGLPPAEPQRRFETYL